MNGRDAVSSTADAAFAVDGSGQIIAWNRGAEASLGWTAKEVKGKHCWELLQGRDMFGNLYCSEMCPIRRMALQGQAVHRYQMSIKNALGKRVHVETTVLVVSCAGLCDPEIVHIVRGPSPIERRLDAGGTGAANGAAPPLSKNSQRRLTDRQLEVLALLSEGRGTNEIAETLFVSNATVRNHIHGILRSLRVHSRLEAVALARRLGLV